MKYIVTEITEQSLRLENLQDRSETLTFPMSSIDPFAHLNKGGTFEITNRDLPYCISLQRRRDIREHHAEEARNGDI